MPQLDGPVLAPADDERQLGVEANRRDVVRVALERLDARLGLVVPDLDRLVVGAADQVGAVAAWVRGREGGAGRRGRIRHERGRSGR